MKGKGWVENMEKFPLESKPIFIPGNGPRVMTF